MNCFAQQAVLSGLKLILPIKQSPRIKQVARLQLPYLLHPISSGEKYILLNRHYKPLGICSDIWCYYELPQYSSLVIDAADIDFSVFNKEQSERIGGCFYFYMGYTPTDADYASKVIAALKINEGELV